MAVTIRGQTFNIDPQRLPDIIRKTERAFDRRVPLRLVNDIFGEKTPEGEFAQEFYKDLLKGRRVQLNDVRDEIARLKNENLLPKDFKFDITVDPKNRDKIKVKALGVPGTGKRLEKDVGPVRPQPDAAVARQARANEKKPTFGERLAATKTARRIATFKDVALRKILPKSFSTEEFKNAPFIGDLKSDRGFGVLETAFGAKGRKDIFIRKNGEFVKPTKQDTLTDKNIYILKNAAYVQVDPQQETKARFIRRFINSRPKVILDAINKKGGATDKAIADILNSILGSAVPGAVGKISKFSAKDVDRALRTNPVLNVKIPGAPQLDEILLLEFFAVGVGRGGTKQQTVQVSQGKSKYVYDYRKGKFVLKEELQETLNNAIDKLNLLNKQQQEAIIKQNLKRGLEKDFKTGQKKIYTSNSALNQELKRARNAANELLKRTNLKAIERNKLVSKIIKELKEEISPQAILIDNIRAPKVRLKTSSATQQTSRFAGTGQFERSGGTGFRQSLPPQLTNPTIASTPLARSISLQKRNINLKIKNIERTLNKQNLTPLLSQSLTNQLNLLKKQLTNLNNKQIVNTRTNQDSLSGTSSLSALSSKSAQNSAQRTQQKTRQTTQQTQRQTQRNRERNRRGPRRIPIPFLVPLPDKLKKKKLRRKKVPMPIGYFAYAKEKGKFKKLNKRPVTKIQAQNLSTYVVDNSTSASGKIMKTKLSVKKPLIKIPKGYAKRNSNSFRKYKIVNGKRVSLNNAFIEKKSKRINTLGEKRGLSVARTLAKLRPKRRKRR